MGDVAGAFSALGASEAFKAGLVGPLVAGVAAAFVEAPLPLVAGAAASAVVSPALSPIAAFTGGVLSSALSCLRSSRCIADTPMSRIAATTLLKTGV